MNKQPDFLPVYFFTGFLESGKTCFIQETLEDPRFNTGEQTLLLLCEEGEIEYTPEKFAAPNVVCKIVEEEEDLTPENLEKFLKESGASRVVVEYNGMWMLDHFYSAMPEDWAVCQEFCFIDARSIQSYNANMRQLTFDKLQSAELVVFNRCEADTDQMALHQLVRTASRQANIIYEFSDGRIQYDEIEDPLPFDLDAPIVTIQDEDYAIWYRDLSEELEKYEGKTIMVTGRVFTKKLKPDTFFFGRHVMTCCAEDIQFAPVVAVWDRASVAELVHGGWYTLTAVIHNRKHALYGKNGPVLEPKEIRIATAPDPEVATFY